MRTIILYIATSLDGYIAGPNDELNWLPENAGEDDFGYADMLASVDTTLMGGRTWDVVQQLAPGNPYPGKTNYVFTRTPRAPFEGVHWIDQDPAAFTRMLKKQDGAGIWLVGGGVINTMLLRAGLIDEIRIAVFPLFLGRGIPLFQHLDQISRWKTQAARTHACGAQVLTLIPE